MKLEPGKATYEIPKYGEVLQGFLRMRTYNYVIAHVKDMPDFGSTLGTPAFFKIDRGANTITFGPTPDRPYEFVLRYYPPMEEF